MNTRLIIGNKIALFRKKNNWTMQYLGDLIGCDKQYVWKMENGKINISFDYLDGVIDKLGCTHVDFFS